MTWDFRARRANWSVVILVGESADKVASKVGNSTTTIRGRRKPVFPIRLGVDIRQITMRETTEVSGDVG